MTFTNPTLEKRPVFIAGFPRTGTTLLWHILQRHSAFSSVASSGPRHAPLVESHFYRRFFSPAVRMWASTDEGTLRTWFADDSAYFARFLLQSFRAFHLEAATARGAHRILDKTPDNVLLCDLIVNAFPDCRILCLDRDPADALASFRRRRTQQPGEEGAWLDLAYDLSSFADTWNRQRAAWRRFLVENLPSGLTVRFAALTTTPAAELQRVLEFIGENPEPQLMEGEVPTSRTSVLDGYWSHVPVPNSEVWHDHVTEADAIELRRRCLPFGADSADTAEQQPGSAVGFACARRPTASVDSDAARRDDSQGRSRVPRSA